MLQCNVTQMMDLIFHVVLIYISVLWLALLLRLWLYSGFFHNMGERFFELSFKLKFKYHI